MSLSFHTAGPNDLEKIQELAWTIWPVWYGNLIPVEQIEYMLRLLYTPEALAEKMAQGEQFFLVNRGKHVVGFMGLESTEKGESKLTKLYLAEEERGRGSGSAMMAFAEEKARERHSPFLILNVNRFNPSLGFYLRKGFSIREQVDIPFGPFWLNDFVMEKNLA